jgi:transposase
MTRCQPIDRDIDYLLPPSVQERLPEQHLARYVVEVVEGLDLSGLERAYSGRGSAPYRPATLMALLIYSATCSGSPSTSDPKSRNPAPSTSDRVAP